MCELSFWFLAALAVSYTSVLFIRISACKRGWLDIPNERSLHLKPTPRIGGVGVLLTLLIGLLVQAFSPHLMLADSIQWILYPAFLVAAISFFDDLKHLPRAVRMLGHVVGAVAILWFCRDTWMGQPLPVFGLALPGFVCAILLFFWLAGLTNAYNFMDGIDGIAAIQGLVALAGWMGVLFIEFPVGPVPTGSAIVLVLLSGGLLGFLFQNWAPAKIFLGDAGSTFFGVFLAGMPFAFAGLGIPFDQALEAGVFFVWPFVVDSSLTFMRRLILREPVFRPHRSHLYQKLAFSFEDRKTGHRITSLVYGLLAMTGVGLYFTSGPLWAKLVVLFWIWTAVFLWVTYLRPKPARERTDTGLRGNFDIFLSPPEITEAERKLIHEALDSGYIAPVGPQVDAFESELSTFFRLDDIQAVNSGTAAIHIALRTLGVGPGDCVLCPDLTFIASVNPVRYLGADPCLVDVDPDTWAMDLKKAREAIRTLKSEGKTIRALVAVHAYGLPAPMESIMELASNEGILVLEDCAGAVGSTIGDLHVGAFGDAAAFSFNGNKVLTTSGGGALYLKDPALRQQGRSLANQGKGKGVVDYRHDQMGYNYRLSNICAAIGLGQLLTLQHRLQQKRWLHEAYREQLSDLKDIVFMPNPDYGNSNHWLNCVGTGSPEQTKSILKALRAERIEAVSMWQPMHKQKANAGLRYFGDGTSDHIASHYLSLPSGSHLSRRDIERICNIIRSAG